MTSFAAGTRAIASIATPRAFWWVSLPTKTNVPGSRLSGSTSVGGGAGFVSTRIRASERPHSRAISARYALGTTIVVAVRRARVRAAFSARTGALAAP